MAWRITVNREVVGAPWLSLPVRQEQGQAQDWAGALLERARSRAGWTWPRALQAWVRALARARGQAPVHHSSVRLGQSRELRLLGRAPKRRAPWPSCWRDSGAKPRAVRTPDTAPTLAR